VLSLRAIYGGRRTECTRRVQADVRVFYGDVRKREFSDQFCYSPAFVTEESRVYIPADFVPVTVHKFRTLFLMSNMSTVSYLTRCANFFF